MGVTRVAFSGPHGEDHGPDRRQSHHRTDQGLQPAVPGWWPVADGWWLPGGWGTGGSLIASGLIAGAMIVYSYRNFRDIKRDQHAEQASS